MLGLCVLLISILMLLSLLIELPIYNLLLGHKGPATRAAFYANLISYPAYYILLFAAALVVSLFN